MNYPKSHTGQPKSWKGFAVSRLLLHEYQSPQPGKSKVESLLNSTPLLLCAHRYEDEINKRTAAENEFVALKKVGGNVSRRRKFKTESWSVE